MRTLSGDAARQLLTSELDKHSAGVLKFLEPFDPTSTFEAWLNTLRSIEEFINLGGELDDDVLFEAFANLALTPALVRPERTRFVLHQLGYLYGPAFADRLGLLLEQLGAMQRSFAMSGVAPAAVGLSSVKMAVGYLQSRRRHLLTLLYLIPSACKGTRTIHPIDILAFMLPQAEMSGTTITSAIQDLMMLELHEDFALLVDGHGFSATHTYPALEGTFLEAERVSILDLSSGMPLPPGMERVPTDQVFSPEELRNNIRLMEAAYSEFHLRDGAFGPVARFIEELSDLAVDSYWVTLTAEELDLLAQKHGVPAKTLESLVFRGTTYLAAVNDYAAFIPLAGRIFGTVTLLSRFLYNWKNVCLYRNRRFQIRTGFLFEQRVREELAKQGFKVTDIKRLKRKEFDVVATRDGIIFNVQCKNNLVDPTWIDLDPSRFLRTNRTLARYYERALEKEKSREQLLKDELGLERVEAFVVTRFPVISANPRIIPLSQIEDFGTLADAVLS